MNDADIQLSATNKGRNRIPDAELASLLEQGHPCILSISRDGKGPIATPVFYQFRDGRMVFGIFPKSAKGKLLVRNGRATITIQTPIEPYQFVMIEGPVHFVTAEEHTQRGDTPWSVMRQIFGRYLESDVADGYAAVLPAMAPDYTIFELTPENVRGESIPRHSKIMPTMDDVPAFLQALEEGKSILEARAAVGLYVREGDTS